MIFKHIKAGYTLDRLKFSANEQNSSYFFGNNPTKILIGAPDVMYDELVFCKERRIIYTHGAFYENAVDGFLRQIDNLRMYSSRAVEGEIVEYIGETDEDYVNGYIYKYIVSDHSVPVRRILTSTNTELISKGDKYSFVEDIYDTFAYVDSAKYYYCFEDPTVIGTKVYKIGNPVTEYKVTSYLSSSTEVQVALESLIDQTTIIVSLKKVSKELWTNSGERQVYASAGKPLSGIVQVNGDTYVYITSEFVEDRSNYWKLIIPNSSASGGFKKVIVGNSEINALDHDTITFNSGTGIELENTSRGIIISRLTEIKDDLTNSNYTWSSEKISSVINSINTNNFIVVDQLPETDIDTNVIYIVPKIDATTTDQKDEYIYVNGQWELVGTMKVNMEDYYTKEEVDDLLSEKQNTLTAVGKLSIVDDIISVDLTAYYTKEEVDNLLKLKQDKISGEGVISVENNVVKADLSDYYNKETVDNKLDTKQNLISGNSGEVLYHNGSDVFTQEVLGENLVVTTQTDLDKCKNISPSFKTVFDSWQRFSHLNGVNNAKPADLSGWEYLEDLNTVRQNNNSESYAGFISPKSYSNYELTIRVFSDDTVVNDDDSIGLVAAFAKDSNGREHTLSFIRSIGTSNTSTGKTSIRWVCVLDYCAFALDSTANGQRILANRSTAVPTPSGVVKWADVPTGSVIYVKREGNVFTAKCSNFNNRTLVEESTMTINLDTLTENGQNTTLNLFKGSSSWGYSTFSQAHSMYENISVVDPSFVIFDLVNSAVLTFDSATSSWIPVAGQNPIELLGAGRFSYNNVTNKLFYNNGTSVVELSSKYYAGNNIKIEDNTISAVISSEDIDIDLSDYYNKTEINTKFNNLATVASTGSYNDLTNKPQLQNLTAGENIEINNSVISAVDTKYTAGEGIEIDEDNKISLVQEEKITEKPAEDDQEVNVFYNYNGVKVVVPSGNGYFNLLNNYIVPDADGNQLFPKGLYIQDDTRSIAEIDASIYELWVGINKSSYILEFNEDLVAEVMEAESATISFAEDRIRSELNSYFNNNNFSNSINAKVNYECIFSKFSISGEYDPLLLRIPLSSRVFNSEFNYRYYHNEVPSNLQIIRKGDYFYDVLGNLYTVSSASFTHTGSSSNYLTTNFSGILSKKTTDSFSITLEEVSSVTTDTIVNIINGYVGKEIAKVKFPTTVSASTKLSYFQSDYSDNPTYRKPYRVTYHFKGFYKNSNDQYCYIYGPSESETINIAMTKRVTQLQNHNTDGERTKQPTLTFCGFLTFGTPYSIELPIQYTTDDSEIQGFSWTNKETSIDDVLSDTSINAVQNKVITTEIAEIRTEFVPHYIELPSDGSKGDIIQYIGYTDDYITNGYFYKYDNIIIPPNTNYISLNNDYPKFKRGVYTEIENPTNFSSLGVVQVISTNFYGDYTIAEGQDEYGTLFNFPSNRFDFFGVPDKTDRVELMKGLDYIQVGELAADEAGNLYRISEVDPNYRNFIIKVKLEIYRLAYDFTLKRNSEPDVTYKLSDVLSQILSETWISIRLDDSTSIQYSLFKTFANYKGDTIYAYKYSSGTSMTGPIYCCSTKLVDGVVRPTFAGFLYWSNWVQTIYIETGSLTDKPQIYTSGDTSVTSDHLGWNQIDVQPNSGGGVISYNDLIDKPTIPQVDNALSDSSSNTVENRVIKSAIDNKITNGGGVTTEIALTKAEYNNIPTKDDNTVYIITDEPVDGSNVFKVCVVGQNTTNISDLVQPYSLIPNNIVILTDLDDNKTYEYTLNNTTKTFKGDSGYDLMFRYIGNNEFKPIVFGIL